MLLSIISFILVFSLLAFSHEFGHFITAKLSGVKVLEFSMGMGPKLLQTQRGETLYTIRPFPIGAYVKMEGEDEDTEDPRSFVKKSPLIRFIILVAGAMMNFLLAYVLLVIVVFGIGSASNTIELVVDDYPAAEAGIRADDTIIAIDGQETPEWEDVVNAITASNGQEISVTIERADQGTLELPVTPIEEGGSYKLGIQSKTVKRVDKAFYYAGVQFKMFFTDIFRFLGSLGKGDVQGDVVGPVGLFNVVGQASKLGIMNLLMLAAYISVNLGIVNLLPFPALDGGRIVFVVIEMIKGSPVDREKEGIVHAVGFAILMALMVFLVFRDISHL